MTENVHNKGDLYILENIKMSMNTEEGFFIQSTVFQSPVAEITNKYVCDQEGVWMYTLKLMNGHQITVGDHFLNKQTKIGIVEKKA